METAQPPIAEGLAAAAVFLALEIFIFVDCAQQEGMIPPGAPLLDRLTRWIRRHGVA